MAVGLRIRDPPGCCLTRENPQLPSSLQPHRNEFTVKPSRELGFHKAHVLTFPTNTESSMNCLCTALPTSPLSLAESELVPDLDGERA